MRTFISSRAVNLIAGLVSPLVLLAVFHRFALLLPWHAALIGGLLSVLAFAWSHSVSAAWLRAAALPGLAFGALFAAVVTLFSAPLAALALIGSGQRLTIYGDFAGALSMLAFALLGAAPLLTLRAYLMRLAELRVSSGLGSRLTLWLSALLVAGCVWFSAGFATQRLDSAMLEREWRPGGAWQRLFEFDAICESGCRAAFVRLYADALEDGRPVDALSRNFTLMYGQELAAVWETERLRPWRWRATASR